MASLPTASVEGRQTAISCEVRGTAVQPEIATPFEVKLTVPVGVGGPEGLSLVTILSGCEINNFAGQSQSRSAITWLPCLTCFGSGSEPCFAGFGRAQSDARKPRPSPTTRRL